MTVNMHTALISQPPLALRERDACAMLMAALLYAAVTAPSLAQAQTSAQPPTSSEQFHGEALHLLAGRQQTLRLGQGVGRIAVGDPDVLDVKVLRETPGGGSDAAELLLTAKAPGSTTLVAWPRRAGPPQSWQVRVRAQSLILERRLGSLPEHAQALAALRLHAPADTPVLDQSRVEVKSNTVQVDVQVVEFKKSALKKAGVNLFSRGANDHGFNFGLYSPATGTGDSPFVDAMNLVLGFGNAFGGAGLDARLSLLEGNGLARVLARPTLLAHSGQSASFLAGGELPIPVSNRDNNISIEYKEFGIQLQLTPTILSNERIALRVAPEASELDFNNAVAVGGVAVPAIRTRRADTLVELADGESFVIGGLVSRNTSSNVSKVPLLGDLPVLGAFFKNLSYSQEETELVIVVTPRLVHPLPAGTDLDGLLPGARSERRNAAQVWEPFVAGGLQSNTALPGFSH